MSDLFLRVALLKVKALADAWAVDEQVIEDLIAKHELPIVQLGETKEIRICAADVVMWIEQHKTKHEADVMLHNMGIK